MARLKIKKACIGAEIFVNHSLTIVFSEHMSNDEYAYALKKYPNYFEPKKVKKNDKTD